MNKRIRFVTHKGKQILRADFSNCSAAEVEKIARAIPDIVTLQPRASVLLLIDFTKASFDPDAIRALKETAVFNKHYVKKSAWIGTENLPKDFEQDLKDFSRRQFPVFKSFDEALSWLITE